MQSAHANVNANANVNKAILQIKLHQLARNNKQRKCCGSVRLCQLTTCWNYACVYAAILKKHLIRSIRSDAKQGQSPVAKKGLYLGKNSLN